MPELTQERARIFRITHIDNVAWILTHGLHCGSSDVRDPAFVQIGNPDLIIKREGRRIPVAPGGTLHDYVPFYFTPFSPMLYNIRTGWQGIQQRPMRDIVILVSCLRELAGHGIGFLITDRHAYLEAAQFSGDLADLAWIDWKILQDRNFKKDSNDPGKFERYQAEALVHRHLPAERLSGIVCHGVAEEEHIREMMRGAPVACPVAARPSWFF
jgi:ssDNA thymidine ADP-ribosyltransferase DarT-like protein